MLTCKGIFFQRQAAAAADGDLTGTGEFTAFGYGILTTVERELAVHLQLGVLPSSTVTSPPAFKLPFTVRSA